MWEPCYEPRPMPTFYKEYTSVSELIDLYMAFAKNPREISKTFRLTINALEQ